MLKEKIFGFKSNRFLKKGKTFELDGSIVELLKNTFVVPEDELVPVVSVEFLEKYCKEKSSFDGYLNTKFLLFDVKKEAKK